MLKIWHIYIPDRDRSFYSGDLVYNVDSTMKVYTPDSHSRPCGSFITAGSRKASPLTLTAHPCSWLQCICGKVMQCSSYVISVTH